MEKCIENFSIVWALSLSSKRQKLEYSGEKKHFFIFSQKFYESKIIP